MKASACGRIALRKKDYAAAVNHFARAVLGDPESAEFLALLGRATFLADHEKHEEARRLLEKSARLDPLYEWTWVYLGQMAKVLGEDARAIECFLKALEINPDNSEAKIEVKVHERRVRQRSGGAKNSGPTQDLLGGVFSRTKKSS